jgi:hypothetical protein
LLRLKGNSFERAILADLETVDGQFRDVKTEIYGLKTKFQVG